MATKPPSALVIDRDGNSRHRVNALLRDAGFAVADCADSREALAALTQRRFDLAVIAGELRDGSDGVAAALRVKSWQSGIRVVVLTSAGVSPMVGSEDDLRLLAHPLDERRLSATVLELLTSDAGGVAGREAAELGVIEAQLACLFNRHAAAERSGSTHQARDIAHQIGDAMAARQNLRQSRGGASQIA
jgi:DNA-binding NtrC family response regulator